jgi:hypothetical protein
MFLKVEGKTYRKRRGKIVEIPKEWVHVVPPKSCKRERKQASVAKGRSRHRSYVWRKDADSSDSRID